MNYLKTTILLAVLTAILIFAGDALGGRQGAVIALIIAGVMNIGSYWFSDKIVLRIYRAKEVTREKEPELYSIVTDLAQKAMLPMPKVYVMPGDAPNAFATGRNPKHAAVAVTEGIRRLLTKEELTGVIGHELAHIDNRDILISTIAATIAGAISYLYYIAFFFGGRSNDRGGNPYAMIAMMIIAPLAAMIIQMAISRTREYAADKRGAAICGNPIYLANALMKLEGYNQKMPVERVSKTNEATAHMFIVNPLRGGGIRKLFSTHPPIAERVRRLKEMAGVAPIG